MAYYNVCPNCGSNLDPGEKCDCMDKRMRNQEFFSTHLKTEPNAGQIAFVFDNREVSHESKGYC
ncbi:MAG: hypothetical protein HFI13_15325 [Lachnospiraceae bacterium]|nr:hypothetical protein [Lachnospiraceae bacterium]